MKETDPGKSTSAPSPAIVLQNVHQVFGKDKGVKVGSLTIVRGRVTAIIAPSGCGKSTLMHLMSGMSPPQASDKDSLIEIYLPCEGGELVAINALKRGWHRIRREIGFVFQDPYLIDSVSGRLNLRLSLGTAEENINDPAQQVWWSLLDLPTEDFEKRTLDLSGGQRQRVALARALVRNPSIVFADEPTANLDPHLAKAVMGCLCEWTRTNSSRTLIVVTHDLRMATRFADDIVVLAKEEGAPGQPLQDPQMPMPNPHSVSRLESLMYPDNNKSCPESSASDPSGDRKHWQKELSTTSYNGTEKTHSNKINGLRAFFAIGWAVVSRSDENNSDAAAQNNLLARLFYAARAIGVLLIHIIGVVCFVWLLRSGVAPDFLPAMDHYLAPLIDGFRSVDGQFTRRHVWLVAFLAAIGIFLALMRLFGRLRNEIVASAGIFTLLLAAGVVLGVVNIIATKSFENRMQNPDIQPILIQAGNAPINDIWIANMEHVFDKLCGKNCDKSINLRSVFGRYQRAVGYYPAKMADGKPTCGSDARVDRFFNVLAPEPDDPIALGVSVSRVPKGSGLNAVTANAIRMEYTKPVESGEDTVFAGPDPSLPVGEIALTTSGIRGLRDLNELPAHYCIDIFHTKSNFADDQLFRLVGTVGTIPNFDTRVYDAIVARDVGSILTHSHKQVHGRGDNYPLAAIWVNPIIRTETVNLISERQETGEINTVPGFKSLKQAIVAADQSASARYIQMLMVAIICGFVLIQLIREVLNGLQQELAVARAFGARAWHLSVLLLAATGRPLVLALASTWIATPIIFTFVTKNPNFPEVIASIGPYPWLMPLLITSLCFIGIWLTSVAINVGSILMANTSIAQQIKEGN